MNFTNGSNSSFVLSNIQSVSFTGQTMNINDVSGTTTTWDYSEVSSFSYSDLVTDMANESEYSSLGLKIYPNPSKGVITISFNLKSEGTAQILISDVTGRVKATMNKSVVEGENQIFWNGQGQFGGNIPNGTYLCRVIADNTSVVQAIVINR